MAANLFQKWGFGAELVFDVGRGIANMGRARASVKFLQRDFQKLKDGVGRTVSGMGQMSLALAPVGLAMGLLGGKASGLASDLEAQTLSMEVLIGNTEKTAAHMKNLREHAAATPFQLADIIDGSKRLLRLTGDNTDENFRLLKLMETMAALDPTKTIQDATESLLDAAAGGGFERLKEFGIAFKADDFKAAGRSGGEAWGIAVVEALEDTIDKKTRGVDLVAKLALTFKGRISTLMDAVDNMLTDIGTRINTTIGDSVVSLTDKINAAKPLVLEAVGGVFEAIEKGANALDPVLEKIDGFWQALGPDGQKAVVQAVLLLGAVSAALIPIAGTLGFLGIGLMGLFTAIGGMGSMLAGVGGMLATLAGGVVFLFDSLALAAVLSGVGPVVFAIVAAVGLVTAAIAFMGAEWSRVWEGIVFIAGPALTKAFEEVREPVMELWDTISGLFSELMPAAGEFEDAWFNIGAAIGWLVGQAASVFALFVKIIVIAVDTIVGVMAPMMAAVANVRDLLLGWIQGTVTAEDAFRVLGTTLIGLLGGVVVGILGIFAGMIQTSLTLLGSLVGAIPGLGGVGDALASGATAVGDFRSGISDQFTDAIREGGRSKASRDRAEAETQASPTPDLSQSPVEVDLSLCTTLEVDGKELAKTQGDQAVRAGERGTGPKLPAEQRARVLRRGLEVSPLGRSEVL